MSTTTTTTTATPQIDAIKKYRAEGNRMEEHVAGNMLRAIRDYRFASVRLWSQTTQVQRDACSIRDRILDGNRIDFDSMDRIAEYVAKRQAAAEQIVDLAYMLSIDGAEYDALWDEIEAAIREEVG